MSTLIVLFPDFNSGLFCQICHLDYCTNVGPTFYRQTFDNRIEAEDRTGSVCLNSFAVSISGVLPGFVLRCDALLGCDAGRA